LNEDPFTRGKQVTFDNGDGRYPSVEKQMPPVERRPNCYGAEPPAPSRQERPPFTSLQEPYREGDRQIYSAGGTIPKQHLPNGGPDRPMSLPPRDGKACDPHMNGSAHSGEGGVSPGPVLNTASTLSPPGPRPPRRPSQIALNQESNLAKSATPPNMPARQSSLELVPAGPPKGPPRRKMTRDEMIALRRQDGKEPSAQRSSEKDCFIIPQGNLERFLPDGITVSI